MYRVFTRMPVELTVGDSGLCCCEDVPLVEFMYRIFTRKPGESYCRRFRSLMLCSFTRVTPVRTLT